MNYSVGTRVRCWWRVLQGFCLGDDSLRKVEVLTLAPLPVLQIRLEFVPLEICPNIASVVLFDPLLPYNMPEKAYRCLFPANITQKIGP